MCGFAILYNPLEELSQPEKVDLMSRALLHRGPDDSGTYIDKNIAFGFRRLSILDLASGHQPMLSQDRRFCLVFNGEIYNHVELRKELENTGHQFLSHHSDTEVILIGWKEWGSGLLRRLNGMFAFAIYDLQKRTLSLCRDRYGIKPLYYSIVNHTLVASSELRGVLASGLVRKEINTDSVLEYFSHQNLWGNSTFYRNIYSVPPASYITINSDAAFSSNKYWDLAFNRRTAKPSDRLSLEYSSLLTAAVKSQCQADVPISSFLSGGIDSSGICALASDFLPRLSTYSCIFDLSDVGVDRFVDERDYSRLVASQLSTDHTELMIGSRELSLNNKRLLHAIEEPRMGMAYVNEIISRKVAERHKVVLSGTGGDEFHAGYFGRYELVSDLLKKKSSRLRSLFSKGRFPDYLISHIRPMYQFLPYSNHDSKSSLFTKSFLRTSSGFCPYDQFTSVVNSCPSDNPIDLIIYLDAVTYLPGLLTIDDKVSMYNSLEARVPLLDNNLVDFLLSLPIDSLYRPSIGGKLIFRSSLSGHLPNDVVNKSKMGFAPPDSSWYRGPLRSFIEELLSRDSIDYYSILDYGYIRKTLDDHFENRVNNLPLIWSLLSFQTWLNINFPVS